MKDILPIYLQLELKKSSLSTDEKGDFLFQAEASNENLDLEQQRTLQRALLGSKDYFLTNGVISKDHLHQRIIGEGENQQIIYDEEFVIGEPLSVDSEGLSTTVTGKLYKSNKHAQKFIELLKEGAKTVKASVGGLMPLIQKKTENGIEIEEIVSVLWNDLALTIAPVNQTVAPVRMIKSLNSLEFVKALQAGCGTNAAGFTGGRALQPESIGMVIENKLQTIIEKLLLAVKNKEIQSIEDAKAFLQQFDLNDGETALFFKAISESKQYIEGVLPMFGKAWEDLMQMMKKSFGSSAEPTNQEHKAVQGSAGNNPTNGVQGAEESNPTNDAPPVSQNAEPQSASIDDPMKKALDASSAAAQLDARIEGIADKLESFTKSVNDLLERFGRVEEEQQLLGKALTMSMEMTEKIGAMPQPRAAAVTALQAGMIAKGGGIGQKQQIVTHKQFTAKEKDEVMEVLLKAVEAGRLSTFECAKIETQINKSLRDPNFQLEQKYLAILQKETA